MLQRCTAGAWGGGGGGGGNGNGWSGGDGWPGDGRSQPTKYGAVAACLPRVIESMFLCLTSHFRDLRVGSRRREGSY